MQILYTDRVKDIATVYNIAETRVTDRQTDRQTDRGETYRLKQLLSLGLLVLFTTLLSFLHPFLTVNHTHTTGLTEAQFTLLLYTQPAA